MMKQAMTVAAVAALAGTAVAQDSVSSNLGGLPGDALAVTGAGAPQRASYVVDLVPFFTSGGTNLGIAPILKTRQGRTDFFNNLWSAQAISKDIIPSVDAAGSYSFWNTAGQGINAQNNTASTTSLFAPGTSAQFAVGIADFGFTDASQTNDIDHISSAIVQVDEGLRRRLYVTRTSAAVSQGDLADGNNASFGFGTIDANGNIYIRADDFGTSGSNAVSGNSILRVQTASRDAGIVNVIGGVPADGADAANTDQVLFDANTVIVPSNNIPESVAGGTGVAQSATFNSEYVYNGGTAPGTQSATQAHLAPDPFPGDTNDPDHRGGIGSFPGAVIAGNVNAVQSNAMLELPAVANAEATSLTVWTVDTAGNVLDQASFAQPATVADSDPSGNGQVFNAGPLTSFRGYTGIVAFAGGTGTAAVSRDVAGNSLVSGVLYFLGSAGTPTGNGDFVNQLVVNRFDPANPANNEWELAAWISLNTDPSDNSLIGKDILDGDGNVIGRLTDLGSVTGNAPIGPSMSSPAFDAYGNLWFIGAVRLDNNNDGFDNDGDGQTDEGDEIDFDSALIRGLYNVDNFSYELELVLELGDTFRGSNSDRNWSVSFLSLATGDQIESNPVSSSFFSSNVSAEPFAGKTFGEIFPNGSEDFDPRDEQVVGGVVLGADIVYDTNEDGEFNDPAAGTFDPALPADESYSALLYIGAVEPCSLEFDANGVLNFNDLNAFVAQFFLPTASTNPRLDIDGNGTVNFNDLSAYVSVFISGPTPEGC